jgi:MSHA pilin protein MshC
MREVDSQQRHSGNNKPGRRPGLVVCSQQGFTLVELIVTVIVAGILAAVVLPRWAGDTGFEGRGFRDETVAALRLAQKSAIAARRTVCASFTATQATFRISNAFGAANCTAGVALAGAKDAVLVVNATGTATYSPVPAEVIFDAEGRPGAAANIAISGLPASLVIRIEAETGYVH